MQRLKNLKHVSFDLWLTLIRSDPEFKPLRNKLFADFFDVRKDVEEVGAVFIHYDRLFNRINEKTGRNVHYSEMLFVILDHLDVDTESIEQNQVEAYYEQMELLFLNYSPVLLDSNTKAILQQVKDNNCSINILSNTGFILGKSLRKILEVHDISRYFDFQLYSDETGCSKPSQLIYEKVFEEAGKLVSLEKHEILHIGDNRIADVAGATRFGFKAALLDQDQNTLSNLFLN